MNLQTNTKIILLSQKDERFINIKEVAKIVGFNVDWVYKQIAKNKFPKPIKLDRSSRWSYLEIMEWINNIKHEPSLKIN